MTRANRSLLRIILFGVVLVGIALTFDKLFPPKLNKFYDQSTLLLDRSGEILALQLAKDERIRLATSLDAVDPLFIRLLIAYEDKRFYSHPGVDPLSLLRALGQWCRQGRIISGGSTLTMQVARLLEPRPRRLSDKMLEIFRALQLEYHYSKQTILEMYLSLAPYGGNLEGIRAASLSYFAKEPKKLNPAEAALLAVLPQAPTRLRPDTANPSTKRFRDKLIARMVQADIFSPQQGAEAQQDKVPDRRIAFPRLALHLLAKKKQHNNIKMAAGSNVLRSTLNKALQTQVETQLKTELPFLEVTQTAAAMIIDNHTREILAYVGSADFFDEKKQGQVDMLQAVRSPGSTLKPFIYGLGFDQKLMHPETIVQDMPISFADYAPSNFRDVFHGEVTIREALQQSLNIPAVLALEKIGPAVFCAWLNRLGIHLKLKESTGQPSLPIALGGVGARLFEIVGLYVALGNQGQYQSLKLFKENDPSNDPATGQSPQSSAIFLSPAASWHITKILQTTHAPLGFVDHSFTAESSFAYKTGTSYGYRDAWAIGYSPDFTLAVWVGKPDGTPSINQTGRVTAAPLLFKLLKLLPSSHENQWATIEGDGYLSLKGHELPKYLRILQSENSQQDGVNNTKLKIQFPKEGSIVFVEKLQPVSVILTGGTAPFYAFMNGKPLLMSFVKPNFRWQPTVQEEGVEFVELTVLDSCGQSDSISIELKQ